MASMKVKVRMPDGTARYEDVIDFEGIVNIAMDMKRDGLLGPFGNVFYDWLMETEPTSMEQIQRFFEDHGARFIEVTNAVEDYQN